MRCATIHRVNDMAISVGARLLGQILLEAGQTTLETSSARWAGSAAAGNASARRSWRWRGRQRGRAARARRPGQPPFLTRDELPTSIRS